MKNTGIFDLIWLKFCVQKFCFSLVTGTDPEPELDPDWAKMLYPDPYW
jgi:hypothetical protein